MSGLTAETELQLVEQVYRRDLDTTAHHHDHSCSDCGSHVWDILASSLYNGRKWRCVVHLCCQWAACKDDPWGGLFTWQSRMLSLSRCRINVLLLQFMGKASERLSTRQRLIVSLLWLPWSINVNGWLSFTYIHFKPHTLSFMFLEEWIDSGSGCCVSRRCGFLVMVNDWKAETQRRWQTKKVWIV